MRMRGYHSGECDDWAMCNSCAEKERDSKRRKPVPRIDEDETVVAALREGRHADDIWLMDCPYCGTASYWNQGSHFTCRECGSHKGSSTDDAYTLADYWETATYPCDEKRGQP